MTRRMIPLLLAVCAMVRAEVPVEIAYRTNGEVRSVLITIRETAPKGVEEISLRLSNEAARNASAAMAPAHWTLRRRGAEIRLIGPQLSAFPARLRVDIGSAKLPSKSRVTLRAGNRKVFDRKLVAVPLPAVQVARSLDGLLYLPLVVTPGEEIDLGVVDPERTPPGGKWMIAQTRAVDADGGTHLKWQVPEDIADGTETRVTYRDLWGDLLVDAVADREVRIRTRDPKADSRARVTGCASRVVAGSVARVCGYFPANTRNGMRIDGRPAGELISGSMNVVFLRIREGLAPGTHVIDGDPALGFPPSDQVLIDVLRIRGEIDQQQLRGADSTTLSFTVEGTTEPVELEITNQDTELVSLEGGDRQIGASSGGTPNTLVRRLRKVAFVPGQSREFRIDYKLVGGANACTTEQEIEQHPDGYVPARVLVAIPLAAQAAMNAVAQTLAAAVGLNVVEVTALNSTNTGLIVFQIPDARAVPAVVAALQADSGVQFAQPDYIYETSGQETLGFNDPYGGLSYGAGLIGADRVHEVATGEGITVAVVDTGVDTEHADLKNKIAGHKDFTGRGYGAEIHGTLIAGIIAAEADNKVGISGIAPGAKVLSLKACHPHSPQAVRAQCWSSALAKAVDFAIEKKAQVVNLSVGGRKEDKLLTRQVEAAVSHGRTVVAAAGNDGPKADPSYPAALEAVMAVTAVDVRQRLYAHATRGKFIDLAAPGVDIISTAPKGRFPACSGTSFATAYVSGTVALLLEAKSSLSPADLQSILESSARDLGEVGKDLHFGSGLVDVCDSMNRALGGELACTQ